MRVKLWGTRGSVAAPLDAAAVEAKIRTALTLARGRDLTTEAALDAFIRDELPFAMRGTFGGNTPCVQIDAGGDYVVCDMGTGMRGLGREIMARGAAAGPARVHVFLSHLHWDHISGFPFFVPAYVPGTRITIHGCHDGIEAALRTQHSAPWFPVPYDALPARIDHVRLEPERTYEITGLRVRAKRQTHSGDSYGYRFETATASLVYSTDSEHKAGSVGEMDEYAAFFRGADLVIFDAMYSLGEAISVREDWGHSSNVVGVDMCRLAGARHLCLFHHEPAHDDAALARQLEQTVRYVELSDPERPLRVSAAYDGMVIEL
jgi:phosphoribosyl 1,2-cyclic phosphodiesterase